MPVKYVAFNPPVEVEGKGFYVTVVGSTGTRYLHTDGVIREGVYPNGYFPSKRSAKLKSTEYIEVVANEG